MINKEIIYNKNLDMRLKVWNDINCEEKEKWKLISRFIFILISIYYS